MEYRSTNADGQYTHHKGAFVAGVDYGSGIELNPTSSGGSPNIMPAGDETNKGITLKAKGTGLITIGDSSNTVQIGNSTTPVAKIERYTVQFTEPDIGNASTYVDSTYTVTGATTNASYKFTPRLTLAAGYWIGDVRCSTANEITIRWCHGAGSTASGSSNRGVLLQIG